MAVKFTIKNGCVGCGMCYAQYANYFQENDDGSAAVNAGKIIPPDIPFQGHRVGKAAMLRV